MIMGALAIGAAWWRWLRALRAPWFVRPATVFVATGAAAWWLIHVPGKAPDFTVFWAAARNLGPQVYNVDFINAAQVGVAPPGDRPFAYPPTFLLLLAPFGFAPLAIAFTLWVASTTTLMIETAGRMTRWPWLMLLSPVFIFTGLIGQSTPLVGALTTLGMTTLASPTAAAVWFALAACIKPQALLLAPLALFLAGGVRPLLVFGGVGATACLAATAAFGPQAWVDWANALPGLVAINDALDIPRLGSLPLWMKPLVLAGAAYVLWDAHRREDLPAQALAMLGGALLVSPHSPVYDATLLLPASLALLWRGELRAAPAAALLVSLAPQPALVVGVVAANCVRLLRIPLSRLWPAALSRRGANPPGSSA